MAYISEPATLEATGWMPCDSGLKSFRCGGVEITFQERSCPLQLVYRPAIWDFRPFKGMTFVFRGDACEHIFPFECDEDRGCVRKTPILVIKGSLYPRYANRPCGSPSHTQPQ